MHTYSGGNCMPITCLYHMPISHAFITCLITCLYHMPISHAFITCLYHMPISHAYITCLSQAYHMPMQEFKIYPECYKRWIILKFIHNWIHIQQNEYALKLNLYWIEWICIWKCIKLNEYALTEMNMHYIEWICRRVNEYAFNWMNMHSTDWLCVNWKENRILYYWRNQGCRRGWKDGRVQVLLN